MHALGLFPIRIDDWSVRLLDSVLQLREERPGLTETEAMTIALALSNNVLNVAYAPQWWLEVRTNCPERATREAQFGVSDVVKTDQLCCVSSSCQEALGRIAEQNKEAGSQVVNSQNALTTDSESPIEHMIEDFWTCVRNLVVDYEGSQAVQLPEALATERRRGGACRGGPTPPL